MVVTINFLDGRKFISRPITVGLEKVIGRYAADAMSGALEAGDLQDADIGTGRDALTRYNAVVAKLNDLKESRDKLILQAFTGQFTLSEYEDNVDPAEAARVINALQGAGNQIIEKNA